MELEPYQIPESYKSSLEKFETDPQGAITSLENRVKKRNAGAIGYFFLTWMHLKNNDKENAAETAWQARIRAPGSKFINRLHYFIDHPHQFNAWTPKTGNSTFSKEMQTVEESHPIFDLDSLITKLSSIDSKRLKPIDTSKEQPDLSKDSANVDDIVTETLAVIHEKQNNYSAAIATYKRLVKTNPDKEGHFLNQIKRLKNKEKETGENQN